MCLSSIDDEFGRHVKVVCGHFCTPQFLVQKKKDTKLLANLLNFPRAACKLVTLSGLCVELSPKFPQGVQGTAQ